MRTICLANPVEEPDRLARAQAHFAEVGLTDVSYATGLHKATSGVTTEHLYMVDRTPGVDEDYRMGPHPTNIWLGHWSIWNALVLSGDREWFVVEVDAKFQPDWRAHTHSAIEALAMAVQYGYQPYDLLYLGSCCTTGRQATHVAGWNDHWGPGPTGEPSYGHGVYTLVGTAPQCNHAYVITRAAAVIMLTRLRAVWAPIDIQQASECWGDRLRHSPEPAGPLVRPLVVYTVLPRIVDQWGTELSA